MLIFVTDKNTSKEDIKHFKDAVIKLPRKMIFVISDHEKKEFSSY